MRAWILIVASLAVGVLGPAAPSFGQSPPATDSLVLTCPTAMVAGRHGDSMSNAPPPMPPTTAQRILEPIRRVLHWFALQPLPAPGFVAGIDNPYLPLLVGSRWVYEGEADGEAERVEILLPDGTAAPAPGRGGSR